MGGGSRCVDASYVSMTDSPLSDLDDFSESSGPGVGGGVRPGRK